MSPKNPDTASAQNGFAGVSATGLQPSFCSRGSLPSCLLAGFLPSPVPSTARAPGSQLLAVVNPKLKAKSSHGKKERRVL